MRQILSKEDIEKKESRNKTIIGIVLAVLMLFSTAGYAFFQNEESTGNANNIEYNGNKFILQSDGLWHFTIQGYEFKTRYNPEEVKNVSSLISTMPVYNGKPMYFSYDSNREGVSEITTNIGRFAERSQFVCVGDCNEDYAIKNCSDNIIILQYSNESLINQNSNCIYIKASEENILRAVDKFIFQSLGI